MLILLPVFLLFLTAIALMVQQKARPSFGYAWLGATGMALVIWGIMLGLRWLVVQPFTPLQWEPTIGVQWLLAFHLDFNNWAYALALVTLVTAVILTASARIELQTTPWSWAGSLAITGAGLLAILADTPLALIFAWTSIDLIELGVFLRRSSRSDQTNQVVSAFAARLAGSFMLVWAMVVSHAGGVPLALDTISSETAMFVLMAAALRLGVIPLHLPYTHELRMWRGLGAIIRLVTPASAFPLISRVPPTVVPPVWAPYFLLFVALAALYGSAMWLTSKDEIYGRPYWLIALAGMAVGCAIRGRPTAALALGTAMILCGGLIFLYSARTKHIRFIPLLGFIGLSGLPYTPAASSWEGLVVLPFNALDVVILIAYSLLLLGYLRHALRPGGDELNAMDRWIHIVYPFGLLFLLIAFGLIGVLGWNGSFTPGMWWAALASLLLALVGWLGLQGGFRLPPTLGVQIQWSGRLARRLLNLSGEIFRLDWAYRTFAVVYRIIQQIVRFLTTIFEGDGGVLWAIVLLMLLITFFQAGGSP